MENRKTFTYNGVNSADYGLYISGDSVYNAPSRVYEMVDIAGRNGQLAIDQGRFENIEVTYPAFIYAETQTEFAQRLREIRAWLMSPVGYQRLEDTYHPDEFRMAIYMSGLEADPTHYNEAGEFELTFNCKPQRFLKSGGEEITIGEWGETQTVSGSVATFEAESNTGIKSLVADIEPIQNLNGYDAPWVGGRKNKLDISNMSTAGQNGVTFALNKGVVTVGGKANANTYRIVGSIQTVSGVQYICNGCPSGGASGKYRITVGGYGYDYGNGYTFTGDGQSHDISIDIYTGYPQSGTLIFKPMVRLASVSDATFEPYENICPISGWSGVNVGQSGKNLFEVADITADNWNGSVAYSITHLQLTKETNGVSIVTYGGESTQQWVLRKFKLIPDKAYSFRYVSSVGHERIFIRLFDSDGNNISSASIPISGFTYNQWFSAYFKNGGQATFTIPANCSYAWVGFGVTSQATSTKVYFTDIQLELGSTATAYEPYNGQTITKSLGMTVYGGTLDLISGVLTVDRAKIVLDGTQGIWLVNWLPRANSVGWLYGGSLAEIKIVENWENMPNLVADKLKAESYYHLYNNDTAGIGVYTNDVYSLVVRSNDTSLTTVDAINSYLSANPITVIYELATPQTYQLTPEQIETLLGVNNIWADSGEVSVEYGDDPNILVNPTPFEALPLIKVAGVGSLTVGNITVTITGETTQDIFIDSDIMEAYEDDNGAIISRNDRISLSGMNFPTLGTETGMTYTGLTSVTVTPRWWTI